MRIRFKLIAGFLMIAVFVGGVALIWHFGSRHIHRSLEEVNQGSLVQVVDGSQMTVALNFGYAAVSDLLQLEASHGQAGPKERAACLARIHQAHREFYQALDHSIEAATALQELSERNGDESLAAEQQELLSILRQIETQFADYVAAVKGMETQPAGSTRAGDALRAAYPGRLLPLLKTHQAQASAGFTRGIRDVERRLARFDTNSALAAIAASVAALSLGLYFGRSIGGPISLLAEAATRVARGQLECVAVKSSDEAGVLADAFNRMVLALRETTLSKGYVERIFDSMREMLVVTDDADRIVRTNRAVTEELGYDPADLLGKPVEMLMRAEPRDAPMALDPTTRELTYVTKDGAPIPVLCATAALNVDGGQKSGRVIAALNIVDRKQEQDRLRASLREKEVLLREIHHRVKNNLQVISSLINLQVHDLADARAVGALRDCRNRILSMAMIHEQLYRAKDLAEVNFRDYVAQLSQHVERSFVDESQAVEIELNVDGVPLPVDLAIPSGIIVNELLTNALKHAFPQRQTGRIEVRFQAGDRLCRLRVADNGVGLQPGDRHKAASLGLRLVEALVEQLGGSLDLEDGPGTAFTVTFAVGDSLPPA